MKPLIDACPDPKKVLELEPDKLGHHVLGCLSDTDEPTNPAIVAKTLSSHYHPSFQEEIHNAVEKALGWLTTQCLLGATPYDRDLMMLTQRGKEVAAGYNAERLSDTPEIES